MVSAGIDMGSAAMAHRPSLIQSSLRADRRGPLLEALDLRPQPRGARILLRRLRLPPSSPGRSRAARDAEVVVGDA